MSPRERYSWEEDKCMKERKKLNDLNRKKKHLKETFCYLHFSVFSYKLLIFDTK